MQSKATEGFFRHSQHSSQFTLQLPHTFHRVLQASSGQMLQMQFKNSSVFQESFGRPEVAGMILVCNACVYI